MLGCLFPSPWMGKTPTQLGLPVVLFLTATEQPPRLGAGARVDGAGPGSLILKAHISMLCWPILEAQLKGT